MLRLRRVASTLTSVYVTLDGRYQIVKDPTSGNEHGGWGYTSWLIYDMWDEAGGDEPLTTDRFGTLRDAREFLAGEIDYLTPAATDGNVSGATDDGGG